jgi:hypothetical protein
MTDGLGIPVHQARHAAAWPSARQVVVALIVVAVIVVLLAAPILFEAVCDLLSRGVERAAPGTFILGVCVLLAGLVSGVRIIDIAGASLVGAVVVAVILNNYLAPGRPEAAEAAVRRRSRRSVRPRAAATGR